MIDKKILITGSQGFIGSHLLKVLLPQNKVIGINKTRDLKKRNYKPIIKDILKLNDVKESFRAIIHLAAITDVEFCNKNTQKCIQTNVLGTLKMLELARKKDCKFVFISTSHVYGKPKVIPIKENHSRNPSSIYAISKFLGENCCEIFAKTYSLDLTILRLFSVYGKNSPPYLVTSRIISQLNKKSIQLGNLKSKRDFVYIDDVVRAIKLILEKSKGFSTYNVGTGKSYSILELCNIIKKLTGKNFSVKSSKSYQRKMDIQEMVANISKIKKMGWKPKTSLEKGLKITLGIKLNAI